MIKHIFGQCKRAQEMKQKRNSSNAPNADSPGGNIDKLTGLSSNSFRKTTLSTFKHN